MTANLNPEKALIFRIVHIANISWILENDGLFCRNSTKQDPNYVNIGSPELIEKRSSRIIPLPPKGTLADYVPFYFTPFSVMAYKIKTGHGGIVQRDNKDIVFFVSSVHRIHDLGIPFVFTNQHAYPVDTDFYNELRDLDKIDWPLLRTRNFKTSDPDPGRQSRYQAEALIHRQVPLAALEGIGCYTDEVRQKN